MIKRNIWPWIIMFFVSIVLIGFLPYLITTRSWFNISFDNSGQVGDTIGGIIGPFVAIIASFLTFIAFWVQYDANVAQRQDLQVERFESKFYELLHLHRANVEEMNIANRVKGRKCFAPLFYEFRACYMIASDQMRVATGEEKDIYDKAKLDLLEFSYSIFFYGIGIFSEKQFLFSFNDAEKLLYKNCKTRMEEYQESYRNGKKTLSDPPSVLEDENYYSVDLPFTFIEDERTKRFYFLPFNGHSDLLGHYYRHLFQTIKFITEQDARLLNFEQKYPYVKMLRAQLTTFEQLLIYYNAQAWFETEWHEFLTDFRLIKNLPIGLADFAVKPLERFKDDIVRLRKNGIEMFENYK
jgi:hypothetical protein